ncbi:hypothetical protein FACS1894172_05420 [Spirochaetia bacterium]|nr:hypothetical protein FACS1894164_20290 [Spirochaetia bacterium]GHU31089.1 hypothetical protein FACS1894172_05420 [Spirochaetia bacterium]
MFSRERYSARVESAVFFVLFWVVLFSGCDTDPGSTGDLRANWATEYDRYQIDSSTISYNDGYSNFAGEIKNNPDFTAAYGVIIVEYTTAPSGVTDSFTAVYWRDLHKDSVLLANAWDFSTGIGSATIATAATYEAAQKKFTQAASETFIYSWAIKPYLKQ